MSRTVVRRVESQRRGRRRVDSTLMAAFAVMILFAIIGLVSSGIFIAGKVSSSSASQSHRGAHSNGTGSRALTQARAEATAIITAAQLAGRSIVSGDTARGRRRAASIVAAAQRRAHQLLAQAQAVPTQAPTAVPPAVPAATSPAGVTSPAVVATPVATLVAGSNPAPPSMAGVPAAWQVIVYGATFGHGPGNAGSISVYNRGATTFSGTAGVHYARGGGSSSTFTIGPHQTLLLPLNGTPYSGGNWRMYLADLH